MIFRQLLSITKHTLGRILSKPLSPSYAVFVITQMCNMRCATCGVEKQNGTQDIDINAYRKLFQTGLGRLDVVKITGGEPFIRRDAAEIMQFLYHAAKPNIFHVTTNGYYTDRIRNFLKVMQAHPIGLSVSIDGTPEIHNKIRGLPGAFENAANTVEMVLKNFKNVNLTINCTISSYNYRSIKEIDRCLKDLSGDRIAYMIADKNDIYDDPDNLKDFMQSNRSQEILATDELSQVYSFIERNNKKHSMSYKLMNRYYMSGLRHRMNSTYSFAKHRCMALWSYFRMLPNGDLIMCLTRPNVVGNITQQGFKDLWFSQYSYELKKAVRSCNMCWKECEVSPSCVYSGDLMRFLIMGK